MYHTSQRVGHRVSVAVIDTSDLVPITVHATIKEWIHTTSQEPFWPFRVVHSETSIETKEVDIPLWIARTALQSHGDEATKTISLDGIKASGAEPWLSITELRFCNLRVIAARGHDYEWLAGGFIPKSRIEAVWPYDGNKLHTVEPSEPVKSLESRDHWVFNFKTWFWVLPPPDKRKADESMQPSGPNKKAKKNQTNEAQGDAHTNPIDVDANQEDETATEEEEANEVEDVQNATETLSRREQVLKPADAPCVTCGHRKTPSLAQLAYLDLAIHQDLPPH